MLQRFADACVDVCTKIRDSSRSGDLQYQGHDTGDHSGKGLRLRGHAPADRKVEHDFSVLFTPATNYQGTSRGDHGRSRNVPCLAKLLNAIEDDRIQTDGPRTSIGFTFRRVLGSTIFVFSY